MNNFDTLNQNISSYISLTEHTYWRGFPQRTAIIDKTGVLHCDDTEKKLQICIYKVQVGHCMCFSI